MIPRVNESKNYYEDDGDLQYDKDEKGHIKWYHKVLLNRTLKVILLLTLVATLTPVLLYQFVFYAGVDLTSPDGYSLGSCLVGRSSRLPCGIGNVSAGNCHHQCCYDHSNNLCFHRFPSRFSYILDRQWEENVSLKPRIATVPYNMQNSLTSIRLSIDEVSPTHLTLTFYNSDEIIAGRRTTYKQYEYHLELPELNVIVNSTQGTIFNTMRGPVIASENIWEIAFKLTDESMYGLGEIPLEAGTVKVIYNHRGGLSAIPLIYAKINDSYHGLLIDTVNPIEVTFRDENVIGIRSITNFGLKFHLFVGPKPGDVMKDVIKHIGFEKSLEYWMLGAHVCNEFFGESENRTDINTFLLEATEHDMPFESHCVRPIVFDNLCDPAQVTHINEGATILRNAGKKFVPHVSPFIVYKPFNTNSTGMNETDTTTTEISPTTMSPEQNSNCSYNIEDYSNYMLQNTNSTGMYKGLVGSEQVLYPNYGENRKLLDTLWIYTNNIDGVILENNWPLDESEKFGNETNLYLPYFSQSFEAAFNHTPAWNATKFNKEKYLYRHNEYANSFSQAFQNMTSHIGTSSQWMNGNVYVSRQNITTSWTNLQKELVEAALGGISGHWLWSTPVCGNTDNFDIELHASLCVKWYFAATYMPLIKIDSKNTSRDPQSFVGTQRTLIINALRNRLMLAPYFYTTLQDGPLLRPMFYQFPESDVLKDLISQFSVGNDLIIVPNLHPSQSMVHVVMPPGMWYEMWSGLKIDAETGESVTMATTEADFLTLIRGGSIVVTQKVTSRVSSHIEEFYDVTWPISQRTPSQAVLAVSERTQHLSSSGASVPARYEACAGNYNSPDVKLTAEATRSQSNFTLTIALECEAYTNEMEQKNSTKCSAAGFQYMAPNTSIHLAADGEGLRITADGDLDIFCGPQPLWARHIRDVNIYGLEDDMNNYDHMRYVDADIDLCELETDHEIVFNYVPLDTPQHKTSRSVD